MARFESMLASRQGMHLYRIIRSEWHIYWLLPVDEISPEILDILMSLGDFVEFKQMMLSVKRGKKEANSLDNFSIDGKHV